MKFPNFFRRNRKRDRIAESSSVESFAADCGEHVAVFEAVRHATMTSVDRVVALCDAVDYLSDHDVHGDIVECGVWRGGSMMAVARTLIRAGDDCRNLWLYDTFDGMTPPSEMDVDHLGISASQQLEEASVEESESVWCRAFLREVQQNLASTNYPTSLIRYVAGPVEETLLQSENLPNQIALLRLDTDWYESTRIELEVLFPRLVEGGVLIVDDYGHWQGCRAAVDEYFQEQNIQIFLNRIDYTARIGIKQKQVSPKERHNVARLQSI